MDFSSPVGDSRQFCSLCYFHFWRPTRVFYLGRFEDVVGDAALSLPRKIPAPETTVLLGNHYFVCFDPAINGMAWQLLPRPNSTDSQPSPPQRTSLRPPLEPERTHSGQPVFPVCWDCFWVIKEFLIHRNARSMVSEGPVLATLDALYDAIHAQWQRTDDGTERTDQRWQLRWPHRSFRGPFVAYDRWERTAPTALYAEEQQQQKKDERVENWHWLVDNPYRPLPSLPDFLLTHLKPTDSDSDHQSTALPSNVDEPKASPSTLPLSIAALNTDRDLPAQQPNKQPPILCLPNELLSAIASHCAPPTVFALRRTCRHFAAAIALDQHFWYRALVTHRLFGFFFDFDSMKIMDETRLRCQRRNRLPPQWDWRRLVGELAHFASFQNGGVMADAPGAFRNRRRIWRILELAETEYGEFVKDMNAMDNQSGQGKRYQVRMPAPAVRTEMRSLAEPSFPPAVATAKGTVGA